MESVYKGVRVCVCVLWQGSRSRGAAERSRATFMHLLWAVLEFEGLLKHLKCKRAGSCQGVKERGEERSEGAEGEESRGTLLESSVGGRGGGRVCAAGGRKHERSSAEDM